MNRQMKFRAWIPDEELMIELPCTDGDHIGELTETGIRITRYNDYIVRESGGNIIETEGYEECESHIMQSTGLKDLNGNEIYEGDFLKDEYDRILLVEWWQYAFTLKAITKTNFVRANYIIQWFLGVPHLPEVIGNIYENKDMVT